jgi:TM2 domain-containing membrane protein YozV
MRPRIFLLVLLVIVCSSICAQSRLEHKLRSAATEAFFQLNSDGYFQLKSDVPEENNVRLTAIALNVTLGVFGMHRLYLGTDVKVPVFYTLTFGGGLVLWVADLGCLIFTKDISSYYDNPHVFMWHKPNKAEK